MGEHLHRYDLSDVAYRPFGAATSFTQANVHRYYDPARGEYLTPDPLGLVDADNRYAYARSNPLANIDPLGLFEIPGWFFSLNPLNDFWDVDEPDNGHGDILRIAFAQYNRENGNRFSPQFIDWAIRNNYHTDANGPDCYPLPWTQGAGQCNALNHWDNPNDGPMYVSEGGGKTSTYTDGSGDHWLQDALAQLNGNRGLYGQVSVDAQGSIDLSRLLAAFGQNSHALADFYAHTNWVDAPTRGGCVDTTAPITGKREIGWIPVGMEQTAVWDETISDKLFSGTVASLNPFCPYPKGDIKCTEDETTHGYWSKDDDSSPGGKEKYETGKYWDVQIYNPSAPLGKDGNPDGKFGVEWYADYGITEAMVKPGTRIYVQRTTSYKFDLAFQLAIEHTKLEIARLYDGAAGLEVGGLKLSDIFKMDQAAMDDNEIIYDTNHSKQ